MSSRSDCPIPICMIPSNLSLVYDMSTCFQMHDLEQTLLSFILFLSSSRWSTRMFKQWRQETREREMREMLNRMRRFISDSTWCENRCERYNKSESNWFAHYSLKRLWYCIFLLKNWKKTKKHKVGMRWANIKSTVLSWVWK